MGLLSGSLTAARFLALGPVPDFADLMAGLRQDQWRPFRDGLEEERFGWVDWRNPLITPPEEGWVDQDRYWVFALRIDIRKVPPALLKAHVDLRLQALQKEKDLAFIGKEARISLADEVKVELLRKVVPTPKVYEVAWERKAGMVLSTGASQKAQGALASLFIKSFGVEIHPLAPLMLAGRVAPHCSTEALMALDPFDPEVADA